MTFHLLGIILMNTPNWLSYLSEGLVNHQPVSVSLGELCCWKRMAGKSQHEMEVDSCANRLCNWFNVPLPYMYMYTYHVIFHEYPHDISMNVTNYDHVFIPLYYYIPVISHDHVIPILFGCRCIYIYSIMISHYIILSIPQYILYFCLYCTYTMIQISEHHTMVSYIKSYISYRITPISIYYGTLYY